MFSYSAYCPVSQVKDWSCFFCNSNVSDAKGFQVKAVVQKILTNTFGFVGFYGKTVVVAFRGTTDLRNWITNLNVAHNSPYPGVVNATVHTGFLEAYDGVKESVRSEVMSLISAVSANRIVFTGHSLGAALATLTAADLAPSLKIPISMYNYGSPRVGNQVFSDYFTKLVPNTIRVTNRKDIVPHLPVQQMGYHHVQEEVWFDTATHYKICDTTGEDPKCSNSVLVPDVPDHDLYLNINLHQGSC